MNNEEKILAMLEALTDKVDGIDSRLAKVEVTQAEQGKQLTEQQSQLTELAADVSDMRAKMNDMDDRLIRVDSQLRRVAVTQENQMDKLVRLLDEDYSNIGEKLVIQSDTVKDISLRVATLKKAN